MEINRTRFEFLILLAILAFAFYIAFIPRLNYLYPLHVDEWVHLAWSEAIIRGGNVSFIDPFAGDGIVGITANLEAGFQLFWGIFQDISGISWMVIFRYGPGAILIFSILSVYALGRRQGFGLEAAFFTALIPTTAGIMGPSLLVPVAMGLPFITLGILVALHFKNIWGYLVLFIITCFLTSIHAATALGLIVILAPYVLLNLKGQFKHSLGVGLALVFPFLAIFPGVWNTLVEGARSLFSGSPLPTYIEIPFVIREFGYVPLAISLLGVLVLAIKGGRKNYGLVLGLLAMLAMLAMFFRFHYGTQIMYTRGLLYAMLLLSVVAGAGLAAIREFKLPDELGQKIKSVQLIRYGGLAVCLGLVVLTLVTVVPDRQEPRLYHMIDSADYQAFAWIRDNVDAKYAKAVLDPWKATAFTAITQKSVYTRIHASPEASDEEASDFLAAGSANTDFLKANGISIVYSRETVNNPDLAKVRDFVYLMKDK